MTVENRIGNEYLEVGNRKVNLMMSNTMGTKLVVLLKIKVCIHKASEP